MEKGGEKNGGSMYRVTRGSGIGKASAEAGGAGERGGEGEDRGNHERHTGEE